ncbi:hypothetical protein ABZW30_08045 [Kitasatospora sp. NPDC004669]
MHQGLLSIAIALVGLQLLVLQHSLHQARLLLADANAASPSSHRHR